MSKNSNTLNSDWRNITINQLSFTNNLILTLSTGFLIYCLDKITPNKVVNNFHQLFLIISFISLTISVLYGFSVMFSRLYDFRISRNIAFVRSRSKDLPYNVYANIDFKLRIKALCRILFCKLELIDKDNSTKIKNDSVLFEKFEDLRKLSKILSISTWIWIKYQALFLVIGFIFYILNVFFRI